MSWWKSLLKQIAISAAHTALESPSVQAKLHEVTKHKADGVIDIALSKVDERIK